MCRLKKKQPILVKKLRGSMHVLTQYTSYHPEYSYKLIEQGNDEYILEIYRR